MSPQVSALVHEGVVEATSTPQMSMSDACEQFVRCEGILPAPEAGHAVWGARHEALRAKEDDEERTIVFNLCGHDHFDLAAYEDYRSGKLEDYVYSEEDVQKSLSALPTVNL